MGSSLSGVENNFQLLASIGIFLYPGQVIPGVALQQFGDPIQRRTAVPMQIDRYIAFGFTGKSKAGRHTDHSIQYLALVKK